MVKDWLSVSPTAFSHLWQPPHACRLSIAPLLLNLRWRISNNNVARARIASIMSTPNVAARPEMAEVGDEQEQETAIALARAMSMMWYTIWMSDAWPTSWPLKGSLTTTPTCKLSVHAPHSIPWALLRPCCWYSGQRQSILFKGSACCRESRFLFELFGRAFGEPNPKSTNSLSRASEGWTWCRRRGFLFDHALESVTVIAPGSHGSIRRRFSVFLEREFKGFVRVIRLIHCRIVIEFKIGLSCVIVRTYSRYKQLLKWNKQGPVLLRSLTPIKRLQISEPFVKTSSCLISCSRWARFFPNWSYHEIGEYSRNNY